MKKELKFVVKLQRPVCRTPIKPVQTHKNDVKYTRKVKYVSKILDNND
jgi:hypothetical protein